MAEQINVQQQKERILSLIKLKGPSLPVQIARSINTQPLFASAFLSELYGERKIRMSNMRVGSSPLYYLEGQEEQLEKFIEHLNVREREAFLILKKEKVLDDEKLQPVVRVALRAIRDFAVPIRIRADGDIKLFWKYYLLNETDLKEAIQKEIVGVKLASEVKKEAEAEVSENIDATIKEAPVKEIAVNVKEEKKEGVKKIKRKEGKIKKEAKEKKKTEEDSLGKRLKEYLTGKEIEILEILLDKKKEFIAKVRIDMIFGKQELLLVAKDKKNVSDNDLTLALQKANGEKMPALFLSFGELNKKGIEYLNSWRNLIKFEKVKMSTKENFIKG